MYICCVKVVKHLSERFFYGRREGSKSTNITDISASESLKFSFRAQRSLQNDFSMPATCLDSPIYPSTNCIYDFMIKHRTFVHIWEQIKKTPAWILRCSGQNEVSFTHCSPLIRIFYFKRVFVTCSACNSGRFHFR